MDHYLEITLLPDPEFPATLLMNALFAKLHRALVAEKSYAIGVSFPDHRSQPPFGLGSRLRLHSSGERLECFIAQPWLRGMHDHLRISEPHPVPPDSDHRIVRRRQAKSPQRMRRRAIRNLGISEPEAQRSIPDTRFKPLDLPYLVLNSESSGQRFRLFIEHGPLQSHPSGGDFSAYGLSTHATIPWF